ncbi:MAG: STM4012 family radical SAM protein [Candidatus Thiodiazotropha sp.]
MNQTTLQEAANRLQAHLDGMPYQNYVYSYPHKTSYREFKKTTLLKEAWESENKRALFLYVHIPFCEMRCGYCNLFTTAHPDPQWVDDYLAALHRQASVTANYLGDGFRFEQLAIGGGTPTYLTPEQLQRLFHVLRNELSLNAQGISVEVSPATADAERLALLQQQGVTRISIGVESFDKEELHALGRPQKPDQVDRTLLRIRDIGVACLNIDLIYGSAAYSLKRWRYTIDRALAYQPEELFLYPLYVRPLTGLARKQQRQPEDHRLEAYFEARERLLTAGYHQTSMRMFVRADSRESRGQYRCQEDGMIGLGAGARSYTQSLHYSSHYAVDSSQIGQIISHYNQATEASLAQATYGYRLDREDQYRRYVLLSLLQESGLQCADYQQRFGSKVLDDLPEIGLLEDFGLGELQSEFIRLNERGIAYSDLIGSWLFSRRVRERMTEWHWQ